MASHYRFGVLVLLVTIAPFQPTVSALELETVSPGAPDRIAEVERRCPVFIWEADSGAAFFELVAYRLPDGLSPDRLTHENLVEAEEVLHAQVPGGAPAWTPEVAEGLERGGSYVWFVRAMYEGFDGDIVAGEWSAGRFFSVSTLSHELDTAEVLEVLRRFQAAGGSLDDLIGGEGDPPTVRAGARRDTASGSRSVFVDAPKSITAANTAIKGTQSDAAGETYGVVGISNSPNGAGVGAGNTNGGADLVIDGSEDGQPDAIFTQAGIDRPSPDEQWFSLINSDTGVLSLNVEGTIVGDGSGLTQVDAGTLDGTEGSDFATDVEAAGLVAAHAASSDHDGRYFNEAELATSGGGGAVHWDNLTTVPVGLADGDDDTTYTAGVGLELSGTQFSVVGFDFTPRDNTITTVDSVGTPGVGTSITIGADGLPVVSYYNSTNDNLEVAHCSNLACTSATLATVDSAGDVGRDASITIGADGLPVIGYYDQTNRTLKVAHCSNLACTSATFTTVDSARNYANGTSITIGADGLPVVSFQNSTSDLKVAHCSNLTCTSATLTTIDSTGEVGFNSSITVGADGLPVISYHDFTNHDLKVAHCSNLACTAATLTTVDSAGDVGFDSSITLGADGLPIISYYDYPNVLKVAHCSDLACTSATVTTIDTSGDIRYNSITIGADGMPVISYNDLTSGGLKVAHCSNPACTTATLTTVDSVGPSWIDTSITIGADGMPVISYWDNAIQGLEVAHCANEFCVPYARRR